MNQAATVATALASALAAATSSVLQHHGARTAPDGRTSRLIGHLLTRPVWILGLVTAVVGLVLHIVALAGGQLALVQPLLISGVLFALPVSALLEGRRPSGREWVLALVLVAGLGTFLLAGRPTAGRVVLDADALAWASIVCLAPVGGLTLVATRYAKAHAPALLGAAAGIAYGLVAALIKEATGLARTGMAHLFSDWPLYVLVLSGAVALALTQMAYRAGPLSGSMPALTVSDPAASVALGVIGFHETLSTAPLALSLQIVGFVVMSAAAAQLARRGAASSDEDVGPAADSDEVAVEEELAAEGLA